jgi:hypothetical protein
MSGPYAMLAGVTALAKTVQELVAGRNSSDHVSSRTRRSGALALHRAG